jgi:hypothetical protein
MCVVSAVSGVIVAAHPKYVLSYLYTQSHMPSMNLIFVTFLVAASYCPGILMQCMVHWEMDALFYALASCQR